MTVSNEEQRMDFEVFSKKVWLSTPTMHGDEMKYVKEAYESNWMSTEGANLSEIEKFHDIILGTDQNLQAFSCVFLFFHSFTLQID